MKKHTPLPHAFPIKFNEKFHSYEANGKKLPSVTTIISKSQTTNFESYRKRLATEFIRKSDSIKKYQVDNETLTGIVGNVLGNNEMYQSAMIGSQVHQRTVEYDTGVEFSLCDLLAQKHFEQLKPFLDEQSEIFVIEQPLCNRDKTFAGMPDRISKYRGKVSVIDFKTKKSFRKKAWIEHHFIQAAAYAELFEDNGGEEVQQLVLLISSRDNQSIATEYIEDVSPWKAKWQEIKSKFN